MKKLFLIIIISCFCDSKIYPQITSQVFCGALDSMACEIYLNKMYNINQPFGVHVFETYMDKRGGFNPGMQLTVEGNSFLNAGGLVGLLTYHQNLYGFSDGLFFQTHLPLICSNLGNFVGANVVTGYYGINTNRVTTIVNINVFLKKSLNKNFDIFDIPDNTIGIGTTTWIKLKDWGNNRTLKLFNKLQYNPIHFGRSWKPFEFPGDVVLGLIYESKKFFIDAGIKTFGIYGDFGSIKDNWYYSIGLSTVGIFLPNITIKTGVVF